MKVKLTAILENDKPAGDISEEKLKMIYQTFFNLFILSFSECEENSDKATVIGAEIIKDDKE